EELLAKIAGGLNAPVSQIASGMNQILSGLARAIKAVGEKNG
ncbi:MAG: 50S ribosomal protein L10, partial [Spirochaetia bacterium]|nr:50S ribosomal protein L10 [Spirochaetia bacterium]